jgi:hypothetical protein
MSDEKTQREWQARLEHKRREYLAEIQPWVDALGKLIQIGGVTHWIKSDNGLEAQHAWRTPGFAAAAREYEERIINIRTKYCLEEGD